LIGACSKRNGPAGNAGSQQARECTGCRTPGRPTNDRRRGHRSKSICCDALERDWRDSDLRRCPLSRRRQARVGVRFRGKADNICSFWAFALLTRSGRANYPSWRHPSGEVLVPTLSVVSSGTRHPFKNKLSILNQPIISTILREIVSPYLSRSSCRVSSRNVPLFDNSSVALHTRTYSGLIPDTRSSVAAAFDLRGR
jgi:hypothetical protein